MTYFLTDYSKNPDCESRGPVPIVTDAHARTRVRKVRRVTRRANDDDTLISPGGRGSFFKGQRGERAARESF